MVKQKYSLHRLGQIAKDQWRSGGGHLGKVYLKVPDTNTRVLNNIGTLCIFLRQYFNPDQKLACFVPYLKIINIFLQTNKTEQTQTTTIITTTTQYIHPITNRQGNSKTALKFKCPKQFLNNWSKQYSDCFDP